MSDILSAICPLLVQQTIKSYEKCVFCNLRYLALQCGFADTVKSCKMPPGTFNSRTGHHLLAPQMALESRLRGFVFAHFRELPITCPLF